MGQAPFIALAAARAAWSTPTYVPHRQMLPSRPLRTSSSGRVRVLVEQRLARGDEARACSSRTSGRRSGGRRAGRRSRRCRSSPASRSSCPGRRRPAWCRSRPGRRRRSSVQAPQLARSQTRLGPVTSSRLRSVSSSVLRGSTVQVRSWPLTLSVILTVPERTFGPSSAALASSSASGRRAGQHGRGRRQARPPQEVAAAVAGRPAGLSWDRVLASSESPVSSPEQRGHFPTGFRLLRPAGSRIGALRSNPGSCLPDQNNQGTPHLAQRQ